jgi:hypothetical protein
MSTIVRPPQKVHLGAPSWNLDDLHPSVNQQWRHISIETEIVVSALLLKTVLSVLRGLWEEILWERFFFLSKDLRQAEVERGSRVGTYLIRGVDVSFMSWETRLDRYQVRNVLVRML